MKRHCILLAIVVFCARTASADGSYTQTVRSLVQSLPKSVESNGDIDTAQATIPDLEHAKHLIEHTLAADISTKPDFVCAIHVLLWKGSSSDPAVDKENWYVYSNQGTRFKPQFSPGTWALENFSNSRILGARRIYLLFVHLKAKSVGEGKGGAISYSAEVSRKTPAYLGHLLGLVGLFQPKELAEETDDNHVWGWGTVTVNYRASDVTITPTMKGVDTKKSAKVFDDEGRYFVDFSIAVPIRSINQLSFDSSNNTVTPTTISTQNAFGLIDLYLPPVDIKTRNFSLIPHFLGGVAIAHQPLHKILIGAGWGPYFAQFYVGVLWVKQDELGGLKPGDTATQAQLDSDLRKAYKAQVAFGINVPVGAALEKLKQTKK